MCESYHQKYMFYRYLTALSHSRLLWAHKNYRNQRNSGSLAPPTTDNHKSFSIPKIVIILYIIMVLRKYKTYHHLQVFVENALGREAQKTETFENIAITLLLLLTFMTRDVTFKSSVGSFAVFTLYLLAQLFW